MAIEIITIKFHKDKELFQTEELQKLIINKKINSYKAEFFNDNGKFYWSVFIDFDILLNEKVDKKVSSTLTESENILLTKLKEWRKIKAEEKGFPVYLVATNEQLIKMIKEKMTTSVAFKSIQGFGQKRIDTYGKEIIEIIKNFYEIKE